MGRTDLRKIRQESLAQSIDHDHVIGREGGRREGRNSIKGKR